MNLVTHSLEISRSNVVVSTLAVACFCLSCHSGDSTNDPSSWVVGGGPSRKSECHISGEDVDSLVVDWNSDERTDLEATAASGIVVARMEGRCDIEILLDCVDRSGKYYYERQTPASVRTTFKNENSIEQVIPAGLARLAEHVTGGGRLELAATVVGRYATTQPGVDKGLLPKRCSRATHIVSSIDVGAFDIKAVDAISEVDGASALSFRAGARRSAGSVWSSHGGDTEACGAGGSQLRPPESCRSAIRIKLVPLAVGYRRPAPISEPPSQSSTRSPRSGSLDAVLGISAGQEHTCALSRLDGLRCWGKNYHGQLGDGTLDRQLLPTYTDMGLLDVVSVAAGYDHTCALSANGSVTCWGDTDIVPKGTLRRRAVPSPVTVLSSGVSSVSAGGAHTCALKDNGSVVCWGYNTFGQLGDGSTEHRSAPSTVVGLEAGTKVVAAGRAHSCAVKTNGSVVCWGENPLGQLGDGSTVNRSAPRAVVGLRSGISTVALGFAHTCALKDDGTVVCWGCNTSGQLGDGSTATRLVPVQVHGLPSSATAITAGGLHTCALTVGGAVLCWGAIQSIGRPQPTNALPDQPRPPTLVLGLGAGVTAISAGLKHTCAMKASGAIVCWGDNSWGQLGNRSTQAHDVPVAVDGY